MEFEGALIQEEGVTFAIAVVETVYFIIQTTILIKSGINLYHIFQMFL
ncbi:hypothetical protein ACFQDF_11015 [Ectobacillus funiculus]